MELKTFFDNFETMAEAPNGVQKLREMILQLAVQGKLVPQDPNDEPASVLMEEVQAKKDRLVKQKTIRNFSDPWPVEKDEIVLTLPIGWEWVRLEDTGYWAIGSGFPKNAQGHTDLPILFCKVSDMNLDGNETQIRSTKNTIDIAMSKKIKARVHKPGTVIFPKIGGAIATNKRRILVQETAIDNNCLGITPYEACRSDWLLLLLRSIDFTKYQSGTSVPAINQGTIGKIVIGLPPLNEQKRIVAKVDELMALCDDLEARKQKTRRTCIQLNDACIDKMLAAREPARFNKHWQRIHTNFDLLYSQPENVNKLRQAILQLAVKGKLVPQDPNDEPASVLLEKIRTEKQQKISNGSIKKISPIGSIPAAELPYDLPKNWLWGRFGEIIICRDGERIPVSKDERLNRQGPYDYYGASGVIDSIDKYLFDKPLLLIGEDGANLLNRSTPIAFIARGKYWVNNHAHVLDGISEDFLQYIELYINATDLAPYITGTAQPKMNQAKMNSILVALPPEREQKRIVAKVDQLMALCDDLEAKLQKSQKRNDRLMEAAVAEMLVV